MSTRFRADNIGSLLRPAELLQARAYYGEERIDLNELRQIEDRAILAALDMQRAAGSEVFTDGEYRRGMFTADITQAVGRICSKRPFSHGQLARPPSRRRPGRAPRRSAIGGGGKAS